MCSVRTFKLVLGEKYSRVVIANSTHTQLIVPLWAHWGVTTDSSVVYLLSIKNVFIKIFIKHNNQWPRLWLVWVRHTIYWVKIMLNYSWLFKYLQVIVMQLLDFLWSIFNQFAAGGRLNMQQKNCAAEAGERLNTHFYFCEVCRKTRGVP